MKIAYVVKRYPRFSETFVINEILAHEAAGVPIEIFSLRPTVDTHFQDLLSRVRAPVSYLSEGQVKAIELWSAATEASRHLVDFGSRLNATFDESALDVYCALKLATACVQRGVSHIHAHFASSAATVARLASQLSGIPYSITAHAKDIFHEEVKSRDLEKKFSDAKTTFTVSNFNLDYLRFHFPRESKKIVRLYNGLPLDDFPFLSPLHRPNHIVAVGRFVEKKGFQDLIDGCAILRDRGVQFVCHLIGGGEMESALRSQIVRLNLGELVQILGPQPQRKVKQLIQNAAMMVAPCILGADGNRDGLPTVLLEAMALGTPCISTDVTGIPEVVRHGESGIIVNQHAPIPLANSMEQLLQDGQMRKRFAESARAFIERNFDSEINAKIQREHFANWSQTQNCCTSLETVEV